MPYLAKFRPSDSIYRIITKTVCVIKNGDIILLILFNINSTFQYDMMDCDILYKDHKYRTVI